MNRNKKYKCADNLNLHLSDNFFQAIREQTLGRGPFLIPFGMGYAWPWGSNNVLPL